MAANVGFLDSYLPYLLRRADQSLSSMFYETLARYGIARSEWRVLAVLAEQDNIGVLELATAALSPQPTVTHALRRLETRGLVTRTHGAQDRRQRIISMTSAGRKLTNTLIAEAQRLEALQLEPAGDLTNLISQLRDLTAQIDAHHTTVDRTAHAAG